jgi:hypothetical protein
MSPSATHNTQALGADGRHESNAPGARRRIAWLVAPGPWRTALLEICSQGPVNLVLTGTLVVDHRNVRKVNQARLLHVGNLRTIGDGIDPRHARCIRIPIGILTR